ncbi:unnamed protein product [Lactuca virosa]|uniref:Uncharacterized protein n=1 Tax=Lactuca virosa TaxID=75947 RepID=A0AAU9MKF1_9ASTR|nr:unnamed protein product [Lactuca virosa]
MTDLFLLLPWNETIANDSTHYLQHCPTLPPTPTHIHVVYNLQCSPYTITISSNTAISSTNTNTSTLPLQSLPPLCLYLLGLSRLSLALHWRYLLSASLVLPPLCLPSVSCFVISLYPPIPVKFQGF